MKAIPMRQMTYVAERTTKNGAVRYPVKAISLLQAVEIVQYELRKLRMLGVHRNDRVVGYVDVDGSVVEI